MKNENKSFNYRVGQITAAILMGCLSAIIIAITAKLIFWIV